MAFIPVVAFIAFTDRSVIPKLKVCIEFPMSVIPLPFAVILPIPSATADNDAAKSDNLVSTIVFTPSAKYLKPFPAFSAEFPTLSITFAIESNTLDITPPTLSSTFAMPSNTLVITSPTLSNMLERLSIIGPMFSTRVLKAFATD